MSSQALEDYEVLRTIGCGAAARVVLALYKPTGEAVVLKILSKQQVLAKGQWARVRCERGILATAECPFIVAYKGAFQDPRHLYIALEYVPGGELYRLLQRKMAFDYAETAFYACEVLCALSYLHHRSTLYRDLKPENLLLTSSGHIKLVDFGAACVLADQPATTMCGTPEYMSPEMVTQASYSFPCDLWALGILIYEMAVGHAPFRDDSPMGLYAKILNQEIKFPKRFDDRMKSLILGLLTRNPLTRMDESAVKSHIFFKGIDWSLAEQQGLRPPFTPLHRSPTDSCNFESLPDVPDYSGETSQTVWEGF